jgi:ferrous iron transport protein A
MPGSGLLPLECVRAGEWAEVEEVTGQPDWICRMAELGVKAGSRVCVLRQGSPCLLQVGGCRLCLRGEAEMRILVRPVSAGG